MHALLTTITAATIAAAASAGATPTILNGSFYGTVGMGTAPTDWGIGQATPDVVSATGPFNNTGVPWTLSPDGGTFVRLNGVGNDQSESIIQNVSGFTPGTTYTFSFWMTNLGFTGNPAAPLTGSDGVLQIYIDGAFAGQSDPVSKQANTSDPIVWEMRSVDIAVTSSDFELELYAETLGTSIGYVGIDGLSVREVPAPGALAILGLSGLAASRRRR